jgi:hypothetical protein
MKILHVFRHPPDDVTRQLVETLSRQREATEFPLYLAPVDYDLLMQLILTHDQVISWW